MIKETQARLIVDPLPFLIADEAQLIQLFQNLISNALKFRGETVPKIYVSAKEEKNKIIFSITDNEIGIEPQYAERIFLLFQRLHSKREYPGTGIGLAAIKIRGTPTII